MSWSEPWVRVAATSKASPELASQAENVNKIMGANEQEEEFVVEDHRAIAINKDNIIPSRQISADNKCERFRASPVRPNINAEVKVKWIGDIRYLWIFTIIY